MASWNDLQAARQNDLMRYYNSKVVQQDQATPQSAALQEKKNKGGFFGGVGYTLEKLGLGALRSIEGMTDYLVGGAADILGQDDFAEELMKSDWVNYEHADEWYNPNKVMSFVGDVSSGVGGMLPSIAASAAVTLATGGAGAGVGASLLSQGVGTALFGLGAAGQSTSQAVKETGTLGGKEWLYGTGSGALEAGIEAASGGIGGTLAGTAFGKQLAKTTGGKIATTFLGEGLEEVASDITDPLLKKATGVDKKAKVDWSNLPRTFLVGGATGAVLGGAGRAINAAKAGGFNNLGAIETANKLTKEKAKVNLQQVNNKAFEQEQNEQTPTQTVAEENQKPIKYAYTPQEIRETENKLGERVQKMDEKTRQEFMESNPQATRNLNEDGTVKPAVTVTQDEIDTYDKNSYSASLQGHEGEFEYTPSKKPTQVIKNVMKKLTQLTQGKAEIVLTDNDLGETAGGKKINGLVKNGIIYLKADSTDAERTMFVGSHEIMHTLEGTREYSNLAKFIQSEIKNNPRMRLKYNLDDYISAYAGAQEQNYSNYTKLHEAQTEMYADFVANEILSNPDSVNRLVKDNRNFVKKMLDWVRNALKRIGMTKDERETYNTLRQMEKLLSNALEAGRGGMALDAVERRYQEARAKAEEQKVNETSQSTTTRLADARMSINVFTDTQRGRKSNREHGKRFALQIGDTEVSTTGKYQFETDTETLLRDISEQNSIERFMPKGLSADFIKAIRKSNGFAPPRLYRGMEAAEMDYIIENGFIKSNSSYNFTNQQGQTRFSPQIQTALSYATGFAPAGIRERFFEQGLPAYIVEVGNYADLNFVNEDTMESYTKKEIDTKYITRVIELTYDAETKKVKARDIQIDGMNQAEGELLHGVPSFVQDKVTGTILYEHQDTEGYEDGKYISEKNPDILFDFDMVEEHKGMAFDYNGYLGISGDPANLVPYKADGNVIPLSERFKSEKEDIRYSLDVESAEEEPSNRIARIQRVTEEQEPKTAREKVEIVKQKTAEKWLALKIETTNVQAGIEEAAKRLGVNVEGKVQKARSSRAAALNMILNNQMDYTGKNKLGKSLKDIFEPVHKKGDAYTVDFYEYLLQQHNIDRMSLEEKAKLDIQRLMQSDAELSKVVKDKELDENERNSLLKKTKNGRKYLQLLEVVNKPVFDESVTAQDSRARVDELQLKHPEFAKMAEEVWNYNKNLLQRRVDAGLITQEIADDLNSKYPHYVPTFRDTGIPGQSTAGASNSKYGVEVKKTIKTAKGSNLDILDISVMMSKQTQAVIRAEAINELAKTLYEVADAKNDFTDVMIMREEDLDEAVLNSEQSDIDYENEKPKNNEVTFYRNGKRVTMAVSQPVFIGFEAFNGAIPYNSPLLATAESINNIFKKGVTAWNPLFLIRNAVRDFQEAIFYTKNGIQKFIFNLPKAIKAMAQKSEVWQQYLAIGGHQSGYFNNETGVYDNRSKIKKGASKIGEKLAFLNQFIEQIPRFNEFMLSIESGKSVEDALLDSAEVTTNFSRGGKLTKTLNRTLIPFLNPSVQGWSKLWRTAVGRKNARQWTMLIVKALAFGLAVGLINDLINGDDEDYKNLNVRDKENYFIFPIGDGKFIKIPKGRVVAALGSVASRTKSLLKGDDKAFDGWFTSVSSMVSPVDQISRDIFSPFRDVKSNTTWYGGEIEGSRLQNYAPSQRYDESTSSIAIGLGKVFNYSPKKIHYLIDQYSGVFGDILLPMTTAKAEKDMISSAFVIDSTLQNNISTEFYDTLDSITYAKNAGDPISAILLRYMNKASNGASDLYQQKRDIQNDKFLSNKEKQKQTKIIQATINTVLQSATQNVEKLEQILIELGYEDLSVKLLKNAAFKRFDEKQQVSATQKFTDYYYASAMAELVGEKKDVKYYFYDEVGGADTSIYLTEIAAITSDKDKNGKSIANSRKTKVHNYIEKLKISALQKYMLMYLAGYTPSKNGKQKIEQYLTKKGYKQEDLVGLWD